MAGYDNPLDTNREKLLDILRPILGNTRTEELRSETYNRKYNLRPCAHFILDGNKLDPSLMGYIDENGNYYINTEKGPVDPKDKYIEVIQPSNTDVLYHTGDTANDNPYYAFVKETREYTYINVLSEEDLKRENQDYSYIKYERNLVQVDKYEYIRDYEEESDEDFEKAASQEIKDLVASGNPLYIRKEQRMNYNFEGVDTKKYYLKDSFPLSKERATWINKLIESEAFMQNCKNHEANYYSIKPNFLDENYEFKFNYNGKEQVFHLGDVISLDAVDNIRCFSQDAACCTIAHYYDRKNYALYQSYRDHEILSEQLSKLVRQIPKEHREGAENALIDGFKKLQIMYEIRRTPYKDPPALWDGANNAYKYSRKYLSSRGQNTRTIENENLEGSEEGTIFSVKRIRENDVVKGKLFKKYLTESSTELDYQLAFNKACQLVGFKFTDEDGETIKAGLFNRLVNTVRVSEKPNGGKLNGGKLNDGAISYEPNYRIMEDVLHTSSNLYFRTPIKGIFRKVEREEREAALNQKNDEIENLIVENEDVIDKETLSQIGDILTDDEVVDLTSNNDELEK